MKTNVIKNNKVNLVLVVVVTAAFTTLFKKVSFKTSNLSQIGSVEAINYEMVRPEASYSSYSLEGREVDLEYEALKQKKIAEAKKANEDKNKKAVATKKIQANIQKAAAQADKKQQAEAISNQAMHNQSSTTAQAKANSSTYYNYSSGANLNVSSNAVDSSVATPAANSDKSVKKSFAQWRTEIYANPTQTTMAAFISAFRKGEISETEFQAMAQDLVDQSDVKYKGLGLMALRSQPSLASFSQLVHAEAQLPSDLQAYVQQAYLVYFQPQSVSILSQILTAQDKVMVSKSLTMLSASLDKVKSGDLSTLISSRNRRDAASENITLADYKGLITSLTALSSSSDQGISSLAKQMNALLQAA